MADDSGPANPGTQTWVGQSAPPRFDDLHHAGLRVALICMPFASAARPSMQIGLVSAIARQAGFEADQFYFNLDLAARLSLKTYESLCEQRGHMTGEWLFSAAAFDDFPQREEDYFAAFPDEAEWATQIGLGPAYLTRLRSHILPCFIEECCAEVDWSSYDVVGFSSTFQQQVACLALARRIKRRHPSTIIVFGGANLESDMGRECIRAFPFIDYVVSGEAEDAFPALLRSIASSIPAESIAGILSRSANGHISGHQSAPIRNLDASPVPDYREYFDRAGKLELLPQLNPQWKLPFESSRGCWWGNKHHCTFCGLNGAGMVFRAKTPARVLEELTQLARAHRITSFEAVDNILDLGYITKLFNCLETSRADYTFFYEVKANLTRPQLQALHRGGVRHIQPGIESMSSHVLALMRKGCTMLQNVRCLKWARYYNIGVQWNLLWGFPEETEADYDRQLEVLRCITHLEPPTAGFPIWLERFSPYFTDREAFPVHNVRPKASYQFVYPEHVDLEKVAYFFDYDMGCTVPRPTMSQTLDFIAEWRTVWLSHERHSLVYRRTLDGLFIDFKFGSEREGTYSLFGALALIYEYCGETIRTAQQVWEYLQRQQHCSDVSEDDVEAALERFCRAQVMLSEDGKYLGLALPVNPNW